MDFRLVPSQSEKIWWQTLFNSTQFKDRSLCACMQCVTWSSPGIYYYCRKLRCSAHRLLVLDCKHGNSAVFRRTTVWEADPMTPLSIMGSWGSSQPPPSLKHIEHNRNMAPRGLRGTANWHSLLPWGLSLSYGRWTKLQLIDSCLPSNYDWEFYIIGYSYISYIYVINYIL